MNCPECDKVVPINKVLQPKDDAVVCVYCNKIIPAEDITWKDGKFHFMVLGDVRAIKVKPRELLKNQEAPVYDISKILEQSKKIIKSTPNIRCFIAEFAIAPDDIRVELITEPK